MSIQAQLNNDAFSMLPRLSEALKTASQYVTDQMIACALREIMNSSPCLADMNQQQIENLDNDLMDRFNYYLSFE